jgi:hypothetical protein
MNQKTYSVTLHIESNETLDKLEKRFHKILDHKDVKAFWDSSSYTYIVFNITARTLLAAMTLTKALIIRSDCEVIEVRISDFG